MTLYQPRFKAHKSVSLHTIAVKASCRTREAAVALQVSFRLKQYVYMWKGRKPCSVRYPMCLKSATSSGWPLRQRKKPEGKILQLSALHLVNSEVTQFSCQKTWAYFAFEVVARLVQLSQYFSQVSVDGLARRGYKLSHCIFSHWERKKSFVVWNLSVKSAIQLLNCWAGWIRSTDCACFSYDDQSVWLQMF